jgi:hypothetical protein
MIFGAQQRNVRQTSIITACSAFFRLDGGGESVANRSEPKKQAKNVSELGILNA